MMPRAPELRCTFSALPITAEVSRGAVSFTQRFMTIEDMNDGMSVTNDIEAVLHALVWQGSLMPLHRVIYADSEGVWDEVIIDEQCRFVDFKAWRAPSRDVCVALVIDTIKEKPRE